MVVSYSSGGFGAQVLGGPGYAHMKSLGGMQGPVRIPQHFPVWDIGRRGFGEGSPGAAG
jgi:hypothetical protein